MNKNIKKRLKQLDTEEFIWILYIGIIILSFYSNKIERKYFIFKNKKDKEKYRIINTLIFSILLVVYLYFLNNSVGDLKNIKKTDSNHKKNLVYLSFLGSLLITISGIIFLYIILVDKEIEIELAFN